MLKTLSPATTTNYSGSNFKTKCGEIHYQTTHFSILCICCGITSQNYMAFLEHFQYLHLDEFTKELESAKHAIHRLKYDPLEIVVTECAANTSGHAQLEECQKEAEDNATINEKLQDFVDKCKMEAVSWDPNASNKKVTCDEESLCVTQWNNEISSVSIPIAIIAAINDSGDESDNQLSVFAGDGSNSDSSKEEQVDWSKPYAPNLLKTHNKRPYKPRNKPNICNYCGRTFRRRYQLDTHLNIHTGLKPHQCEICGKTFRAITTLSRHRSTHDQRDTFTCRYCAKRFTHKAALLSHELRHTQERHVPCDECEKMFYTLNQLDTHKRKLHHKPDYEALAYACDLCPKRYRSASMLSTHRFKKHYKTAKFNCEQCDKKFIDEEQLKSHKLIHIDRLSRLNL